MDNKQHNYSVAVIATMSAGKSSLLNALMGVNLLPSQNEACTATVFRITDVDEQRQFVGRFHQSQENWSTWYPVNQDILKQWNRKMPQEIELYGDIPNIGNTPEGVRLCFIDTPGPNNAMCKEHSKITQQVIAENDFSTLIFVINASVAGVRDEYKLLFDLKEQLAKRKNHVEVIFALNKIDLLDSERGESLFETVKDIRSYLEHEIGFEHPLVIPVCSRLAAYIRYAISSHRRMTVRQLAQLQNQTLSKRKLNNLPKRKRTRLHYLCKLPLRLQKEISNLLVQFRSLNEEYRKALDLNGKIPGLMDDVSIPTPSRQVWIGGTFYTYRELFELEVLTGIPCLEKNIARKLASFKPAMNLQETPGHQVPFLENQVNPCDFDIMGTPLYQEVEDFDESSEIEDEQLPQAKPLANVAVSNEDFDSITPKKGSKNMLQLSLAYNPYLVTTRFSMDGQDLPEGHKFYEIASGRLQNWIDNLLPAIFKEFRDKQLCIEFTGTEYDWEDVISAIQVFNEEQGTSFTAIPHLSAVSEDRIKKIIDLYHEGMESPFSELFASDEMKAAFGRAIDPIFEANVIATMSSGKSTVVNAFLGQELMPAKNEACTATLSQITDDDSMAGQGFLVQRFDRQGNELSKEVKATRELLTEWNDDPQTHLMKMRGDIPTIKQTDAITFVLTDTPGPNNARNAEHEKATLEAIQSKPLSMVIYVLNATQLSTNDDDTLLRKVCAEMNKGGRQAHDRFVFIANKIDAFDPEKGESVTLALEHVRQYLRDHGIMNPIIIPASAQLAKILRLPQESLTRAERGALSTLVELFAQEPEMNMLNHCKKQLSAACVNRLEKRLKAAADTHDEKAVAEILSGIPIVEELLNDFLQKHAIPAKLKDAVDTFAYVLQQSTIANAMNEEMAKSKQELQESVDAIRKFTESKEMTTKAQEFRRQVQELKYQISKDANETIRGLNMESEEVIKSMQAFFGKQNDIERNQAHRLVEDVLQKCQSLEAQVGVALNDAMKKEYYTVMDKLREDYQNFAAKAVGKSFPSSSLETLTLTAMTLPSAREMVQDYTTTKIEQKTRQVNHGKKQVYKGTKRVQTGTQQVYVGERKTGKWWNPFSWGSHEAVYETRPIYEDKPIYELVDDIVTEHYNETKSSIDMPAIAEMLTKKIRSFTMQNVDSFKKQAEKNVESAKQTLLSQMDCIDQKLKDILEQLDKASASQSEKKKLVEENEKKVAWFKDFYAKLQAILAI